MALSIELWTSEGLAGGAEHWWDFVEVNLYKVDPDRRTFPLLWRVDPYGDAVFTQAELGPLAEELQRLAAEGPPAVVAITSDLVSLCEAGMKAPAAELRFVGD